jgi:hypothetical protein
MYGWEISIELELDLELHVNRNYLVLNKDMASIFMCLPIL